MEVKSCKRCKGLFHHVVGPQLCQKCKKRDEEDFVKVKDYLYENPGASMTTVCDELEVTVRQIQQYLREGRLTVSKDSPIAIECERCNARILTGRYCDSCRASMTNQFSSTAKGMKKEIDDRPQEKQSSKMRYLDSDTIRKRR
ncbi:MAG TPA: hypothetical protein GX707_12730 [Epulopiscium sp.]|nr:hypothetical protein [Candidatus Epulonipiscium sp.]